MVVLVSLQGKVYSSIGDVFNKKQDKKARENKT